MTSSYEVGKEISLYEAVCSFYVLEELRLLEVDIWKKSQERWKADLEEFAESFNQELANAMYDYLVLACFGEARHAARDGYIQEIEGSRDQVFYEATEYNPKKSLPLLQDYFSGYDWPSGYGGAAWANIAEIALSWYFLPPGRFIDSVVDLSHNNGTVFSKNVIFRLSNSNYRYMLNRKFDASLLDWSSTIVYPEIYSLLQRAQTLGLTPEIDMYVIDESWEYSPIMFGEKIPTEAQDYACTVCGVAGGLLVSPDEDESVKYCVKCYNEKYVSCWECSEVFLKENAFSHDFTYYCQDCFNTKFVSCESCKKPLSIYESYDLDGQTLCESCYSEQEEENEENAA